MTLFSQWIWRLSPIKFVSCWQAGKGRGQPKLLMCSDVLLFGHRLLLRIVETPAQFSGSAPAAYYLAPPADGSRPGTFYINTFDLENRCVWSYSVPGFARHHIQNALLPTTTPLTPKTSLSDCSSDKTCLQCCAFFATKSHDMKKGWSLRKARRQNLVGGARSFKILHKWRFVAKKTRDTKGIFCQINNQIPVGIMKEFGILNLLSSFAWHKLAWSTV